MSKLLRILPKTVRIFTACGVFLLVATAYLSTVNTTVAADDVKVTTSETCNVKVNFEAIVPTEVQQGETFMITGIMVQPTQTFGFNVTSSPYTISSTNTDSTTYEQDFKSTNPSPTSGAQTYKSYYPDWSLKATGAVGSTIVIKPVKTVTNVQGYGKVTCDFHSTLATIKIVAPAPTPSSPPPGGGGSQGGGSSTGSGSGTKQNGTKTTPRPTKTPTKPKATKSPGVTKPDNAETDTTEPVDDSSAGSVVSTLAVRVLDSKDKPIVGADVVLDGTIKQTTNKLGGVIFPNVLTGSHSITATFGDRKVSTTIKYSSSNLGKIYDVKLPNSSKGLYILLGVMGTLILIAGGLAGTILSVRAKNRRMAGSESTFGNVTLSGVAGGQASPEIPRTSVTQIPVVPMHEQAVPQAIMEQAPWHVDIPANTSVGALTEPVPSIAPTPAVPVAPPTEPVAAPLAPPVAPAPQQSAVADPPVIENIAPQYSPPAQSNSPMPDYDVDDS